MIHCNLCHCCDTTQSWSCELREHLSPRVVCPLRYFLSLQQNQTYDSHRAGDGRAKGEKERKACCHSGTVLAQDSFKHWASPSQQQYWHGAAHQQMGPRIVFAVPVFLFWAHCLHHATSRHLHLSQDYFHAVQVPWFLLLSPYLA